MYDLDQWLMWAAWMLPLVETVKEIANQWNLKTRLKPDTYALFLHFVTFLGGLGITIAFEADLFLSMTGEYQFEPFVGYIAGAVALAGGETLIALLWDWRVVIDRLKPVIEVEPDA